MRVLTVERLSLTALLWFFAFLGTSFNASSAPNLTIGVVEGHPSTTVNVPVNFVNNGSVVGLQFDIQYDASQLSIGTPVISSNLISSGHGVASSQITTKELPCAKPTP